MFTGSWLRLCFILKKCNALHDLVLLAQFKNRKKHSWSSVIKLQTFGLQLKVTLLHGRFSYFLNCKNDIKSRKASQIIFHYHLEKNKSYENRSYQPSEAATRCVL